MTPIRIAFVRHVGPYDQVGEAWSRLMGWAGRKGLLGPVMLTVGIAHDAPDITPAEKLRYDAGLAVPERVEPEGEIGIQVIGGGEYATATHRGPYDQLSETYNQVYGTWLPASGRELRDVPAFEQYLNAPQFTPPEQLLTVIHAPLS